MSEAAKVVQDNDSDTSDFVPKPLERRTSGGDQSHHRPYGNCGKETQGRRMRWIAKIESLWGRKWFEGFPQELIPNGSDGRLTDPRDLCTPLLYELADIATVKPDQRDAFECVRQEVRKRCGKKGGCVTVLHKDVKAAMVSCAMGANHDIEPVGIKRKRSHSASDSSDTIEPRQSILKAMKRPTADSSNVKPHIIQHASEQHVSMPDSSKALSGSEKGSIHQALNEPREQPSPTINRTFDEVYEEWKESVEAVDRAEEQERNAKSRLQNGSLHERGRLFPELEQSGKAVVRVKAREEDAKSKLHQHMGIRTVLWFLNEREGISGEGWRYNLRIQ